MQREAVALLRIRITDLEARCSRGRNRLRPFWSLGLYWSAGWVVGALATFAMPTSTPAGVHVFELAQQGGTVGVVLGALIEFCFFMRVWRQAVLLTRLRQQLTLAEVAP